MLRHVAQPVARAGVGLSRRSVLPLSSSQIRTHATAAMATHPSNASSSTDNAHVDLTTQHAAHRAHRRRRLWLLALMAGTSSLVVSYRNYRESGERETKLQGMRQQRDAAVNDAIEAEKAWARKRGAMREVLREMAPGLQVIEEIGSNDSSDKGKTQKVDDSGSQSSAAQSSFWSFFRSSKEPSPAAPSSSSPSSPSSPSRSSSLSPSSSLAHPSSGLAASVAPTFIPSSFLHAVALDIARSSNLLPSPPTSSDASTTVAHGHVIVAPATKPDSHINKQTDPISEAGTNDAETKSNKPRKKAVFI